MNIARLLAGFSEKSQMFDNEETIKQWIKERGGKDYDGHVVSDVARTIHGWNEARRRQSTGT